MSSRSNTVSRAVLVAIGIVGVCGTALADHSHKIKDRHYNDRPNYGQRSYGEDYGRVVNVEPLVSRVRVSSPQRECWDETREVRSAPSRTEMRSTLIGGLIGAAVGHRISQRGHVQGPAGVIGGSIVGAAIGNNIGVGRAERRGERYSEQRVVEQCAVSYREQWEERVDAYRVTYIYHGREYTTRMPYDPGQKIRVNVAVSPDFDREYDYR